MDHNTITEETAWKQKRTPKSTEILQSEKNPIEQGASHKAKPSWKDTCDVQKVVRE